MIRINLLPHREEKRKQRRQAFVAMMVFSVVIAGVLLVIAAGIISGRIANQEARNNLIKSANAKLDEEIKEVASLREEIDALKARQKAVEDLQSDRNQPVHLLDELAKQTPEGVYLRSFKQDAQRVVVNGYAQSNERVSELLRNLGNNSSWLERPDLVEIRATGIGTGKDAKKVFDFTVNVGIKREITKDAAAGDGSANPAGISATGAVPGAVGMTASTLPVTAAPTKTTP